MRFTGPTLLLVPPLRTVRESFQLTRSSLRERSNHERARVRSDGVASGEIRGARPCCQSDINDRLLKGSSAQIMVLIDGSDSSVAGQAINVTTSIGLDESLKRVLTAGQTLPVEMRPKILFNPDSRSPNFFFQA